MKLWCAFVGFGAAASFLLFLADQPSPVIPMAFGAVVVAVLISRQAQLSSKLRPVALLLVGSYVLGLLRMVLAGAHAHRAGVESVHPNWGDIVFPIGCLLVVGMLLVLVRERTLGRDPDAWIDSLLISAALTVALWTSVMSDYLGDSAVPSLDRMVNLMYFVISITVFTVALRVLAGPGVRSASYFLVFLAVLTSLAIDLAATLATATGSAPDVLFFAAPLVFALGGASVLHPNADDLVARPDDLEPQASVGRVLLLAVAMLMPQVAVLIGFKSLTRLDLVVLGAATVVMGALVMMRFLRLVRSREQLLESETSLRSVGGRLLQNVTTSDVQDTVREEIPAVVGAEYIELSGIRVGTEPVAVGHRHGRRSNLAAHHRAIAKTLDLAGDSPEVSAPIHIDGRRFTLFAVRANDHASGAEPTWLWTLSETALGRHQRYSLRSLARECDLALRGAEAAEVRAREESERRWKEGIVRSERRFRALVQHSSDIVAVVDADQNISYISPAVRGLLGYDATAVTGQSLFELVDPTDREKAVAAFANCRAGRSVGRVEFQLVDTTGRPHMMEIALANHESTPDVEGIVVNARDVTVARELEEDLERVSSHDAKTGLLNRDALVDEIQRAVQSADGQPHEAAILVVQLEQFEMITNGLGFEAVDEILGDVADRINQAVRVVDLVARIEGSQFAVLVRQTYGLAETEQLAARVLDQLTGSIEYEGTSIPLDTWIGIAMSGSRNGSDLLRLGHTALRAGKTQGQRVQGFESPMVESVMEQLELRSRLEEAIENNEMFVQYQPLVSLEDGHIQGAEALVRWQHPDRGVVGPYHFIPLAEETGLVVPLGEWVLREVCRQVAEWESQGLLADDMMFSLNFSAVQLADPRIVAVIADAVKTSGVDPKRLVAELTETFFMDTNDDQAAETLTRIRAMGLRVAIDDFGTGYSSLDRISRFPLDIVKIDRAFVSPLDDGDPRHVELLEKIIGIIDNLGACSLAEGIETGSEAEVLRNLGCNKGQGYFFARPMDAMSFHERLVEMNAASSSSERR